MITTNRISTAVKISLTISVLLINLAGCKKSITIKNTEQLQSTLITQAIPAGIKGRTPRLHSLTDGMLLSWVDVSSSQSALKFSRFHNGQWSPPVTVQQGNNWLVNYADFASVTPLDDRHYAAIWLEKSVGKWGNYRFMLSQSFDAGTSWSTAISPISKDRPGEHGFVAIQKSNSKLLVSWISQQQDVFTIQSMLLDKSGNWDKVITMDTSVCSCCHIDMAPWQNSILAVYRDRTSQEIRDIAMSSFENNKWSRVGIIENDGWKINGCPVNGPSITATGHGWTAIWFTAAKNGTAVKMKAYSGEGKQYSRQLDSTGAIGYVDTTAIENKQILMMWLSLVDKQKHMKLQTIDPATGQLGPLIDYPIPQKLIGFPSIVVDQHQAFISFESAGHTIKVYSIGLDRLFPIFSTH